MNQQDSENKQINKQNRSWFKTTYLFHNLYKRNGSYTFIGKNTIRLIIGLIIFAVGTFLITEYLIDLQSIMDFILLNFPDWIIVGTLFISESFLGILPPDFYIIWALSSPSPYIMVFILALSSYTGGIVSYQIGSVLHRMPKIHDWIHHKFETQLVQIRKFGGLLIFIAALTPLPFSPISIVAGLISFKFNKYLIVALSRFLRFALYALVLSKVVI